ncbi:hypothetical protein HWV62_28224, partial [Athelia sp. TMB]
MSTTPPQSFLRQRNPDVTPKASTPALPDDSKASSEPELGTRPDKDRAEVIWGKTPNGEVFRVPATHDVLTALFHPAYPKSHFDLLNLGLLGLQIVLFFVLPRNVSQVFFLCYFAFWRAAYDAGLGWVLTQQSKKKWVVREVQRRGWLDEKRHPAVRKWIRDQLVGKMGKDYSFDDLPVEYNTWLLFRQAVDVILLNDFLAYCMFAFASFRVPEGLSIAVHVLRWIGGIALIVFNLWVKTEAHAVIKDYAWYWGDVFFHQMSHLIFDGVFELAPHPMYSVGYAGYYGLSLIVGSYRVLFVSLAGHAAQFAFLVFFENPRKSALFFPTASNSIERLTFPVIDIERRYGQRKPIAQRTPLNPRPKATTQRDDDAIALADAIISPSKEIPPTPTATDGSTATESDAPDTETETESEGITRNGSVTVVSPPRNGSGTFTPPKKTTLVRKTKAMNQHDLFNRYFRRDAVLLGNLDFF